MENWEVLPLVGRNFVFCSELSAFDTRDFSEIVGFCAETGEFLLLPRGRATNYTTHVQYVPSVAVRGGDPAFSSEMAPADFMRACIKKFGTAVQ
jgi:hypothetical protein